MAPPPRPVRPRAPSALAWALGTVAFVLVLVGAVVLTAVLKEPERPVDPAHVIDDADVGGGATAVWSAERPEDGFEERAYGNGDTVAVLYDGEYAPDDFAEDGTIVAYDARSGDVRWQEEFTAGPMEDPTLSASGELLLVPGVEEFRAREMDGGGEAWAIDGFFRVATQRDGVVVLVPDHDAAYDEEPAARTLLVDSGSGEVLADLAGDPIAIDDETATVLDGDMVRRFDRSGAELWSVPAPGIGSTEVEVSGAGGDGFVVLATHEEDPDSGETAPDTAHDTARATAFAADDGEVLWEGEEVVDLLERGPGGTVAALRAPGGDRPADSGAEVVLFDRSGEQDAATLEVDGISDREPAGFVAVDGRGDFLVLGDEVVVDENLERVEHGGTVVGLTGDGVYLHRADGSVALGAWDSATEIYEIDVGDATEVVAVDGGLIAFDDGEVVCYR